MIMSEMKTWIFFGGSGSTLRLDYQNMIKDSIRMLMNLELETAS